MGGWGGLCNLSLVLWNRRSSGWIENVSDDMTMFKCQRWHVVFVEDIFSSVQVAQSVFPLNSVSVGYGDFWCLQSLCREEGIGSIAIFAGFRNVVPAPLARCAVGCFDIRKFAL